MSPALFLVIRLNQFYNLLQK